MIIVMENARYKYTVVEDYIEKTVLDGFSAIGGLFGLIGATAALLFGRSIVQLMFGMYHDCCNCRIRSAFMDAHRSQASVSVRHRA